MKRLISILFTVLYLALIPGVKINAHYCHGRLMKINIAAGPEQSCCSENCSNNACCANKTLVVKADFKEQLVHKNNTNLKLFDKTILLPEIYNTNKFKVNPDVSVFSFITDFSPPLKRPIYLTNCSLITYG